ncbi:Tachykinin-like peptides receptor 86C [Zootermopsis nevadensis]|uniref:Tachykinin-like peptides receptor 86C n=1 Tax=Zootermopsis nevadensis TaxID=136037 RepID=A0A067R6L9_ZOONE|nr:Tachykinin-like peptides receptor 86C [Zootermopsis nevadensis]
MKDENGGALPRRWPDRFRNRLPPTPRTGRKSRIRADVRTMSGSFSERLSGNALADTGGRVAGHNHDATVRADELSTCCYRQLQFPSPATSSDSSLVAASSRGRSPMGDAIDDVSLYNCTASLLMQLDSSVNANSVWTLNRSQVVDLLEVALTQTDSSAQWTALRDFISECLLPAQRPYDLAWWQKLMWAVVFGAMLVVATGGNIIVMWIVLVMLAAVSAIPLTTDAPYQEDFGINITNCMDFRLYRME